MIQEGGLGAYGAIAMGALGFLLGCFAVIALVGGSRSSFALGVATLIVAGAAAGVGMVGTVYGRHQVERAIAFVGSGIDKERILRVGTRESQSSSLIGFFAALLPLVMGGAASVLGSRLKRTPTRVQGFAEPNVSSDDGMGQTMVAAVFVGIAAIACSGAWLLAHGELPKVRYDFADEDQDAWSLAGALDDVAATAKGGPNRCDRLADALDRFWVPDDKRAWPRKFRREVPPVLAAWRGAADGCAKQILESFDSGGLEPAWTQEGLLESSLLQDEALHARALAWTSKTPDAEPGTGGGGLGLGLGLGGGLGGGVSKKEPIIGMGSLTKEDITGTIRKDLQAIRLCYERALTKSPQLEGKVMVKFVIGADGRVSLATDDSDVQFPDPKVTQCVLGRIRALRFPKPVGGGVVNVKYPFVFKSAQ